MITMRSKISTCSWAWNRSSAGRGSAGGERGASPGHIEGHEPKAGADAGSRPKGFGDAASPVPAAVPGVGDGADPEVPALVGGFIAPNPPKRAKGLNGGAWALGGVVADGVPVGFAAEGASGLPGAGKGAGTPKGLAPAPAPIPVPLNIEAICNICLNDSGFELGIVG